MQLTLKSCFSSRRLISEPKACFPDESSSLCDRDLINLFEVNASSPHDLLFDTAGGDYVSPFHTSLLVETLAGVPKNIVSTLPVFAIPKVDNPKP